jgi:hypothetical protein
MGSRNSALPPRPPKKPRALGGLRGAKLAGLEIATQRCDSATPSFIPSLNAKGRPESRPLACLVYGPMPQ